MQAAVESFIYDCVDLKYEQHWTNIGFHFLHQVCDLPNSSYILLMVLY